MDRSISVSSYVGMAFEEVIRVFEDGALIDRLLNAAMEVALPTESAVHVHAYAPQQIAGRSARVKVEWSLVDRTGTDHQGTASLQLFVLQSGNEPLTELLVTLAVDEPQARAIATGLHEVLDDLTDRLVVVSPHR